MPRLSKRERLRRERISRALRAYHREQRRRQEARSEAALHYWRRVKHAAGRHGLTVDQARRAVRLSGEQAIPVQQAVHQIKVVRPPALPLPPPPGPPPVRVRVRPPYVPELLPEIPEPEPILPAPLVWASADPTREEIAWNLEEVVDGGYEVHPREVLPGEGTLEADFKVFIRGQYQRMQTVEFESARSRTDFWSNFYAALRPIHDETVEAGFDSGDISITVTAIRMA